MYYRADLARVHYVGFGFHADACAPGILALLAAVRERNGLVVELGCGSGHLTRHLLEGGHRVIATDASPAMLELAGSSSMARMVRGVATTNATTTSSLTPHTFRGCFESTVSNAERERIRHTIRPGGCSVRGATCRGSADPRLGGRPGRRLGPCHLFASRDCGQQRRYRAELGVAGRPRPVRSQGAVPAGRRGENEAGNCGSCRSADGDSHRWRCRHGAGCPISDQRFGCDQRQLHASRGGKNRRRHRQAMTASPPWWLRPPGRSCRLLIYVVLTHRDDLASSESVGTSFVSKRRSP
ncbi:MAG: class I SAM-dependent methyltransferase [Acidobacteria bacterium]|nr:class I SAM-dependent methyltransferase [Acidobacteriota bacterium]